MLFLQGFGEVAVNIFCREAQEAWKELFPFADDRTLKLAAEHGLPDDAVKLAELVGNDRHKYVRLLAALIRSNLRKVPVDNDKGAVDSGELVAPHGVQIPEFVVSILDRYCACGIAMLGCSDTPVQGWVVRGLGVLHLLLLCIRHLAWCLCLSTILHTVVFASTKTLACLRIFP